MENSNTKNTIAIQLYMDKVLTVNNDTKCVMYYHLINHGGQTPHTDYQTFHLLLSHSFHL